jgi:hypothetical protein
MPSADPKVDAIESIIVGEKGDDNDINRAGKGGVVDKGGNGANEDASPQHYLGNGAGGNKHQKNEDI